MHENFRRFRGTTEPEWMAWLRTILVRSLTDFQNGFRRERRNVTGERSLESFVDRSSAMLRNLHELDWNAVGEKTGRSPDAARMLWARAMQRVGGLLQGRVS